MFDWIHQGSPRHFVDTLYPFHYRESCEAPGTVEVTLDAHCQHPQPSPFGLMGPSSPQGPCDLFYLEWQWRWYILHPRESLEPMQTSTGSSLLSVTTSKCLHCWSLSLCLWVRPWLAAVSQRWWTWNLSCHLKLVSSEMCQHNMSPLWEKHTPHPMNDKQQEPR